MPAPPRYYVSHVPERVGLRAAAQVGYDVRSAETQETIAHFWARDYGSWERAAAAAQDLADLLNGKET